MNLLSSDKSSKQIIAEQEGEVASEVWSLIEGEEVDLEKLRQLEKQKPTHSTELRAERALKSLAVMIQEDLDKIEQDEEVLENELSSANFDGTFREAASHNLKILELVTEKLVEDDNKLEKWLSIVDKEEKTEDEIEELLEIETNLEKDLEKVKNFMKSGGDKLDRGWIELSQFT